MTITKVRQQDPQLERVRKLARVLDDYKVDPMLGLFLPGAGDMIGSVLGLYTIAVAVERKVSPVIIARMLMNLTADAVLGILPVIGDAADFAFKAHKRNLALLVSRSATGGRARARDWFAVIGALVAFLGVIGLAIYGIYRLIRAIA